jgi:hypothetical protein
LRREKGRGRGGEGEEVDEGEEEVGRS